MWYSPTLVSPNCYAPGLGLPEAWDPDLVRDSVIAEVYPARWSPMFSSDDRNPRQHDAYSVTRWMQASDAAGGLAAQFHPPLSPAERTLAQLEGWILGIG